MYAATTDLEKRITRETLIELTDDNHDGAPDTEVINAVITGASARIDAYLGARYAAPVNPVIPIITGLCVSLCVPLLFARKREPVPQEHQTREKGALELLQEIKNGNLVLSGITGRTLAQSSTLNKTRHFSPDRISGF